MLDSLLNQLRSEGYLHGDTEPFLSTDAEISHWILALQMIGGWLAAVFMLLFLGMGATPLIKGAASWVALGLIMTMLAGFLIARSLSYGGTVWRQFLLVISLAGQGALLVGGGLFGHDSFHVAFFMISVYELVLLLRVEWMPHRLVVALLAVGTFVTALNRISPEIARYCVAVFWLAVCMLWYREHRWLGLRYGEAVYAMVSALTLMCFAYALSGFLTFTLHRYPEIRLESALICAVNILFTLILLKSQRHKMGYLFATAMLAVALGVTWQAQAVGMGALALVFGFMRGRRWLMWLGGALLVFGIGRYYYDLQLTLLYKSALMALGGLLLLAVRALIVRRERESP